MSESSLRAVILQTALRTTKRAEGQEDSSANLTTPRTSSLPSGRYWIWGSCNTRSDQLRDDRSPLGESAGKEELPCPRICHRSGFDSCSNYAALIKNRPKLPVRISPPTRRGSKEVRDRAVENGTLLTRFLDSCMLIRGGFSTRRFSRPFFPILDSSRKST